jgi:hypothetical protein
MQSGAFCQQAEGTEPNAIFAVIYRLGRIRGWLRNQYVQNTPGRTMRSEMILHTKLWLI